MGLNVAIRAKSIHNCMARLNFLENGWFEYLLVGLIKRNIGSEVRERGSGVLGCSS